jgi:nucleotide-binding universal stress UspA family protein
MGRALIVGYDGSPCADAALDAALELAGATGDRLVIAFGYEPSYGPGEEFTALREEVRKFGERATAPALERALAAGVEASLALVDERPVEALLDLAEQHDARAIVVGTYGEHPMKGALIGSVPHKLLHVSERPVIAVPVADPD